MAAALLHELGHAFNQCEYMTKFSTTNVNMLNVAAEFSKDVPNKEHLYKELKNVDSELTIKEIDELLAENNIVVGIKLYRKYLKWIGSNLSTRNYSNYYTGPENETLADNFASRFGLGRELVTALYKLHKGSFSPEASLASYALFTVVDLLTMIVIPAKNIYVFLTSKLSALATIEAVYKILRVILINILIFQGSFDTTYHTYEGLKNRFRKIRNDAVQALKDMKLTDEHKKRILAGIYEIDDLIDQAYTYRSLYNIIAAIVFPSERETHKRSAEQQLLEELAYNNLFVKSSELTLV
jgi:hypothetical protein